MTVKEYNHIGYRLYSNANTFVSRLNDALQKAGPEAEKQARCLGWTPEMQEYILCALSSYHESIRTQLKEEGKPNVEDYIKTYGEIDFPGEKRNQNIDYIKANIEASSGRWMASKDGIHWIDATSNLSNIDFRKCLLRKIPSDIIVGVKKCVKNSPELYQYSNDNGASWHDIAKGDYPGACAWIYHGNHEATWFRKKPEKKICNTNKPAKRAKYMPRINAYRGENRIKQNWLTENFGDRFVLVWTGHSHFAKDTETGERFYIFKKEKFLLTESLYCNYYFWKKWKKQGMEQLCTSSKYSHEFDKLGTEILVLGKAMQIRKGE